MTAADIFLASVRRHQRDLEAPADPTIWSPSLESASPERIREIQSEKLRLAFDYLVESSAYHRQRYASVGLKKGDIRSIDDLTRIPVTRKTDWLTDIADHPPFGTFSPLRPERWNGGAAWTILSTSGTTRQPRLFRRTAHDRAMFGWIYARMLHAYGVRPHHLAFNCFFHGPSIAAWGMFEGLRLLGCASIPAGPMSTDRRAMYLTTVRPTVLLGTPSTLLSLASRLTELGHDPRALGVEILVCAGEPGAAVRSTKTRLEAVWKARAHDDFGCTELGPLGHTCGPEAARQVGDVNVHLMQDTCITEVLEPNTLEPVPPGTRGTLVVSNLYSESGPFLRFDIGDWASVTEEPCACGRTGKRVVGGLLGRNDHCLTIKGLQFFPSTFEDALRSLDGVGDEYRIEVRAEYREGSSLDGATDATDRRRHRDVVTVLVEQGPGETLSDREVARRMQGLLGISVNVKLLAAGTLPRTEGKGQRFVDFRDSDA